MRTIRNTAVLIAVALLAGCAGMSEVLDRQEALRAPKPLQARQATTVTGNMYRAALASVEKDYETRKVGTVELVDAGIAAANASCRQWFAALSDAERRWSQGEGNVGVVQNLITGVLGAARAPHDLITAWGLGTSAYGTWTSNFRASVLALSEHDIQTALTSAMASRARQMREQAATMTLPAAIDAIDEYQRLCSAGTAQAITKAALSTTTITVDSAGQLKAAPK